MVIATGEVTTLAGISAPWSHEVLDGIGPAARFGSPDGITTDGVSLYVTDATTIRKVEIGTGAVTTLAGALGDNRSVDGVGAAARFSGPSSITTDLLNLYIVDGIKSMRKLEIATGKVTTLVTFESSPEAFDGAEIVTYLRGITTDGTNLYVGCGPTILKIVITTGEVTTLAGDERVYNSADGIGTAASFRYVDGLTTDGTNLYVTDYLSVRKVVLSTGEVTTVAGTPTALGHTDGTGAAATFGYLSGITTDGTSLFVTDTGNSTIRRIR